MAGAETEDLRAYFSRIRPIYYRLFNIAFAITGSSDQAEYCLQSALLECRDRDSFSSHGLREGLRSAVVTAALRSLRTGDNAENEWNGLPMAEAQPTAALILRESAETQRILTLRYGCRIDVRKIARICRTDVRHVRAALRRFEARAKRKMSPAASRHYDAAMVRAVNTLLDIPADNAPDIGRAFRSFPADAASMPRLRRLPVQVLRSVVVGVLVLACIAAFWFAAVLLQPPVLVEDSVAAAEQINE